VEYLLDNININIKYLGSENVILVL
jgi:hypothetical protein